MRLAAYETEGHYRLAFSANGKADSVYTPLRRGLSLGDVLGLDSSSTIPSSWIDDQAAIPWSLMRAPFLPPTAKIFGLGMNYSDFQSEAEAAGLTKSASPAWFMRPFDGIVGHEGDIWLPPDCMDLDYEAELVIVIGRVCYQADLPTATAAIGGYTCGNDVTFHRQALRSGVLGKSHPRQASLGPAIVTAGEIADPQRLGIRLRLNGELRQDSSTACMIVNCGKIVSTLSAVTVLNPGDVIFTGTPAGCGAFARPPRFLRAEDELEVEIDGVGALRNRVVPMPNALQSLPGPGRRDRAFVKE